MGAPEKILPERQPDGKTPGIGRQHCNFTFNQEIRTGPSISAQQKEPAPFGKLRAGSGRRSEKIRVCRRASRAHMAHQR
jgi:hypothetical protein